MRFYCLFSGVRRRTKKKNKITYDDEGEVVIQFCQLLNQDATCVSLATNAATENSSLMTDKVVVDAGDYDVVCTSGLSYVMFYGEQGNVDTAEGWQVEGYLSFHPIS